MPPASHFWWPLTSEPFPSPCSRFQKSRLLISQDSSPFCCRWQSMAIGSHLSHSEGGLMVASMCNSCWTWAEDTLWFPFSGNQSPLSGIPSPPLQVKTVPPFSCFLGIWAITARVSTFRGSSLFTSLRSPWDWRFFGFPTPNTYVPGTSPGFKALSCGWEEKREEGRGRRADGGQGKEEKEQGIIDGWKFRRWGIWGTALCQPPLAPPCSPNLIRFGSCSLGLEGGFGESGVGGIRQNKLLLFFTSNKESETTEQLNWTEQNQSWLWFVEM